MSTATAEAALGRISALSHLDALESEAVHIFREVAGEFERPVILFSGGKDSIVMLHLALKAFAPAPVPFTPVRGPGRRSPLLRGPVGVGLAAVGDRVTVHPSGETSEITGISVLGTEAAAAYAPQSVGLRLADQRDVSRGDMITAGVDAPALTQDVRAAVCQLADRPLRVGDRVLLRHTTRTVKAVVKDLAGATELTANDLGRITLRTAEPLALDDYAVSRRTGAFIVIDPADGATLTAGMTDLP